MQTEQLPRLEAGEYPGGIWYYEPHTYLPYRYVLAGWAGTRWCASASTPAPPSPARWTPP